MSAPGFGQVDLWGCRDTENNVSKAASCVIGTEKRRNGSPWNSNRSAAKSHLPLDRVSRHINALLIARVWRR